MKITKEEKMYLERCGYGRKDFAQIQEATRRDKTTYEMDGAPITRDEAVTRLGRLDYLSGIARSAFHFTAMRITEDGKVILFDSSRLLERNSTMDNPYLKAQCQNMVSALAAFSTACELAAYEDDGSLSKEELRQLRRIHAAAARFQAELQREMEKRHVPTAKRLSAGCRSQKDGEYDALI